MKTIFSFFLFCCASLTLLGQYQSSDFDYESFDKPIIDIEKVPYVFKDTLLVESIFSHQSYPNFLTGTYTLEYSDKLMLGNRNGYFVLNTYTPGDYYFKQWDDEGGLILEVSLRVNMSDSMLIEKEKVIEKGEANASNGHFEETILFTENLINQPLPDFEVEILEGEEVKQVSIYDLLEEGKENVLFFSYYSCPACQYVLEELAEEFQSVDAIDFNFIYVSRDYLVYKDGRPQYKLSVPDGLEDRFEDRFVELPLSFGKFTGNERKMDKEMYFLGYPAVYFLDKNLKIRTKHKGYSAFAPKSIKNFDAKMFSWQLELTKNAR